MLTRPTSKLYFTSELDAGCVSVKLIQVFKILKKIKAVLHKESNHGNHQFYTLIWQQVDCVDCVDCVSDLSLFSQRDLFLIYCMVERYLQTGKVKKYLLSWVTGLNSLTNL